MQDLPFDVSVCVFVLEQALSVRALQEMVSAKSPDTVRYFVYDYSFRTAGITWKTKTFQIIVYANREKKHFSIHAAMQIGLEVVVTRRHRINNACTRTFTNMFISSITALYAVSPLYAL